MTLHVLRYFPTLTETFVHDVVAARVRAGESMAIAAFDARGCQRCQFNTINRALAEVTEPDDSEAFV